MSVGIYFAQLYMQILRYRKCDKKEREKKFRCISFISQRFVSVLLGIVGLSLVVACLSVGHHAIAKPYSWSMAQNVAYFALTRSGYSLGVMLFALSMILGSFVPLKEFLRAPVFLFMGNLCMVAALVTPMTISIYYDSENWGNHVSFDWMILVGGANIVFSIVYSAIFYIFWSRPVNFLINTWLIKPFMSSDKLISDYQKTLDSVTKRGNSSDLLEL